MQLTIDINANSATHIHRTHRFISTEGARRAAQRYIEAVRQRGLTNFKITAHHDTGELAGTWTPRLGWI